METFCKRHLVKAMQLHMTDDGKNGTLCTPSVMAEKDTSLMHYSCQKRLSESNHEEQSDKIQIEGYSGKN